MCKDGLNGFWGFGNNMLKLSYSLSGKHSILNNEALWCGEISS